MPLDEDLPLAEVEADEPLDEDLPLAEVESEEPLDDDLPLAEAVADEDLPLAEAVADEDLPSPRPLMRWISRRLNWRNWKRKVNDFTEVPLNVEPDPIPNMDEEELLSLTNAELRSMLASLGASTDGNKKELVERFLDAKSPWGASTADIEEGSTIESSTDTDIGFDSSQTLGARMQPRNSPPIIPEINLIPDSAIGI